MRCWRSDDITLRQFSRGPETRLTGTDREFPETKETERERREKEERYSELKKLIMPRW